MRRGVILAGALLLGIGLALFLGLRRTADYSTPRSAARTFYIALMTDDLETAKASLCDAKQAGLMDDLSGLVRSVLAAREAAIARFGEGGEGVSGGLPSLEDLDRADEKVEGNAATLHCIDPETVSLRLVRAASQWKVDLLRTFSLGEMDDATVRKTLQSAGTAVAEHTSAIKSGRFSTAQEANAALKSAITQAVLSAKVRQMLKW